MPLLSADDATKVRSFFDTNLQDPVTIELFTQKRSLLLVPGRRECEYCEETQQLLEEVAAQSSKLELRVHDLKEAPEAGREYGIDAAMVPAIVLRGGNRGQVRYFGIPAGNEFMTLLNDLVAASTGTTPLSAATKEALASLPREAHIRVFVTPT